MTITYLEGEQHTEVSQIDHTTDQETLIQEESGPIPNQGQPKFTEPPAMVNVMLSNTRNLGDYNSVKVQVGVTMPCKADGESIAQMAEWGKQFCEYKIMEILS